MKKTQIRREDGHNDEEKEGKGSDGIVANEESMK